jgi:nucleotide-binding universal stress UspA family protein
MVSRGREGIGRALLGSTAERVLQGPDPVLIFEPGEDRSRLFQAARAASA